MKLPRLVLRLACISALAMIGAIAISVMTHDAWLLVGHMIGALSAVIAAGAVLALGVAAMRGLARGLPPPPSAGPMESYEQGQFGLDAADPAQFTPAAAPSDQSPPSTLPGTP
ncbi:hypothetical protein [Caulobacter sp. UC70_42]|uniref:hypothetical protein n=1 Tax=Caulobacter sp. UC70_42 TaxID=3374551 RepID=UPI003756B737